MEYRFIAKKSWNIPPKVYGIFYLIIVVSWFLPRNTEEYRWLSTSLLLFSFLLLLIGFRALSGKIILTISDAGISYSGNDYLFAQEIKNIPSAQLSKILVLEQEHVVFEKRLSPTIYLLDQQGKLIKNLDDGQWLSLDDLDLEKSLKICLSEKIELVDRSRALEIDKQQREDAVKAADLGKVGNYFAYASVGLALICIVLAILDIDITLAWGQYKYLIGGIALFIAIMSLMILARAMTHFISIFVVSLIFTTVMTLFIHQSLMLLNYHLGEQKSYRFEKVIQDKYSEVWRTAAGEEVECISSPRKLHDYTTGVVRIGILGVVRVGGKEVCVPRQEIKQGKSTEKTMST